MKKSFFDKLFNHTPMTLKRLVIFAVLAGIYTGLIMLVHPLDNTSFQDIGVSYEWWVVFAVIVVANCEKPWEAALKCFLFFIISQPLVYLVEILLGSLTFDLAKMYYVSTWLPMTMLTLPGGFIAWYCKKQTNFGAVIMGLGNAIMFFMGLHYGLWAMRSFPRHLLSALFSFAAAVIMAYAIQKDRKRRAIAIVLPAVLTAVLAVFALSNGLDL